MIKTSKEENYFIKNWQDRSFNLYKWIYF